jgi:hypothetical protein
MFLSGVGGAGRGIQNRLLLTAGTSLERISDESLTRPDSGFVHGYMWIF